jgi:hypothetical protein
VVRNNIIFVRLCIIQIHIYATLILTAIHVHISPYTGAANTRAYTKITIEGVEVMDFCDVQLVKAVDPDPPISDVSKFSCKGWISCLDPSDVQLKVKLFISDRCGYMTNFNVQSRQLKAVDTSLPIGSLCPWLRSDVFVTLPQEREFSQATVC